MTDEPMDSEYDDTGSVVSYIRYANGTLLEVLTATPSVSGKYGRKKWIHVVRVLPADLKEELLRVMKE